MVSVLLRDEQRKVGRGGVLGCDFMFVQMLEWISATSPHNTLFISAPAPHLNSLLRDDQRFFSVLSFKDGKIIRTFRQHSRSNVLWILRLGAANVTVK